MAGTTRYDDGLVLLDDDALTLRRYYVPFGSSKRIPYGDIREVATLRMTTLLGKWRLWGTSHPGFWLPLDVHRPGKETLVVLDLGKQVKPAFSPDDPDRVLALLRERTG